MQLHRLLAAGLLGVYLCLVWREVMGPPRVEVKLSYPAAIAEPPAPARPPAPVVNVVDVAAVAVTPELVMQLVRLAAGERIVSLDDHPVDDLTAWAWLSARLETPRSSFCGVAPEILQAARQAALSTTRARGPIANGDYIDVAIEGRTGGRRVLVLFH